MKSKLRWGDPPEDAPEAGKIVPPKMMDNLPGSAGAGSIENFGAFGMKLPEWSRVRHVLRLTREYETPFKIDCGDLGYLYVGPDGWEVRNI